MVDNKLELLLKIVLEDAEKEKLKITEQLSETEKSKLSEEKSKITAKADAKFNKAESVLLKKCNEIYSRELYECRKKQFDTREKIYDNLIKSVENRISQYRISDEYRQGLEKTICEIVATLGNGHKKIYVGLQDLELVNSMNLEDTDVEISDKIRLGGVIAENESIYIDETYDLKIKEQKSYFFKISGLTI